MVIEAIYTTIAPRAVRSYRERGMLPVAAAWWAQNVAGGWATFKDILQRRLTAPFYLQGSATHNHRFLF